MKQMVSYCILKEADYKRVMDFMNEMHSVMMDMSKAHGRLFDTCMERKMFTGGEEKIKFLFDFHDSRKSEHVLKTIDTISQNMLRCVVRKFVDVDLGL